MSASTDQREHAVARARRILDLLKQAADHDDEGPSNALLAERVGYGSTSSVADAISFLATCGLIEVQRANHTRVVTICATGKSTAGTVRKAHHSARVNMARAA